MTQYSFSRVDLFDRCPYHFKLKYIDKLTELSDYSASNPLILGSAMHKGIETDYEIAEKEYINSYPIITDHHVNELIKIELMLPKVYHFLKQFEGMELIHEYEINTESFRGYVDLIVRDPETQECLIMDFKYSNSIDAYKSSNQMHVYQHYLELEGFNVTRLGYLFVEKLNIQPKRKSKYHAKDEEVYHFRKRLVEALKTAKVTYLPIEFDEKKVLDFDWAVSAIEIQTREQDQWEKNPTGDCFACNAIAAKKSGKWTTITPPDFLETIQDENGEILMALPNNERRDIEEVSKRILWMYGAPFSGKTWFANTFPDVLMLNTDGNIKFVDAPFVNIADKVLKKSKNITEKELAWDILDKTLKDLETKDHSFKTIVFDLLEDLYTAARFKVYEEEGISHESDNSFKSWDLVTTKFLQVVKRIVNLNVENIIFISHEDISKDITSRAGDKITNIQPNLREKVALKVAGMVDIVGRVVTNDEDRQLVFKSKRYVFSGGRIPNMPVDEIELDYDAFINLYDKANKGLKVKTVTEENLDVSDISDAEQVKPTRSRRKKAEVIEDDAEVLEGTSEEPEVITEEQGETKSSKPRTRRTRKNVEDIGTDIDKEENDANDDEASEPEPKPTRTRRSRAAVTDDVPPGEEEDDEKEEVAESKQSDTEDEATEQPRRRRRRTRGE